MSVPAIVHTILDALPFVTTGGCIVVGYIQVLPLYRQMKTDWIAMKQLLKEANTSTSTSPTSTAPIVSVAGDYPFMVQSSIDHNQFKDIDTILAIYHEALKGIDEPLTDNDKTSIFYRVTAEVEKVESTRKGEVIANAVTKATEDYRVRNMLTF